MTVSLWTAGLVLGYLLTLGSARDLLWACWGASVVLLPLVAVDGRQAGSFSWPVLGGLLVPGLNLLVGAAYALSQFRQRHGKPSNRHGLLFFSGVAAATLAVVVAPYVLGPVALVCGYVVRRRYSAREGALLLTTGSATMLFGLALNAVVFLFLRPGPLL
ncbi:hypothetical protein [Haloarcula brevis]|uniref:hypothetical protein n=1 Tax=Haloarcula brevis TaxID=3111453 RepID=UPI00300E8832